MNKGLIPAAVAIAAGIFKSGRAGVARFTVKLPHTEDETAATPATKRMRRVLVVATTGFALSVATSTPVANASTGTPHSAAQSATASFLCVGYANCSARGYSTHGYENHNATSYWQMDAGHNCTNYAAYVMIAVNGAPLTLPVNLGNAKTWASNAPFDGATVNTTPAPGSIAFFPGSATSLGHVAVVESVGSNYIIVSEDNFGGDFDWAKLTPGGYYPTMFIHFKDWDTHPPTTPQNPQITSTTSNGQATLAWTGSTDTGGSGLAGYHMYLNGTQVATVSASTTTYTFSGIDCRTLNSFAVSAYDGFGNASGTAPVADVVMTACVRTQALNHIVTVQANGTSYVYDSGGLHYVFDSNTYYCALDRGTPVYTVASQSVADVLGNGKPWQPACLSLKRAIGHTVRDRSTGAAYVVTDNSTPYGSWHWEQTGGIYNCLIGYFPRLDATTAEIESLRGYGIHNGANADCAPGAPTSASVTSSTQTSLTLSWHASSNDDTFAVFLNNAYVTTLSGSTTSYTFNGLGCSRGYTLSVGASNNVGLNSNTSSVPAATAACYTLNIGFSGGGAGSVVSSTGGMNCNSSCSGQFVGGTTVTLTQAAGPQSGFWSWSGPCSGNGVTCTFTVNSSMFVGAAFVPTWTIQSTVNGRYVSAEVNYSGNDYGLLRARNSGIGTWEKFVINGNCSSGCAFQSLENHQFVSAELNYSGNNYGELRARNGSWQGWETYTTVGNCSSLCAIRSSANGRFVAAEMLDPGGYYARLRARTSSWSGSSKAWESFRIVRG